MSRRKISIVELKNQLQTLQEKLEREEEKVNCEIGAWVRGKTKVESLKEFQASFVIVNKIQEEESEVKELERVVLEED